VELMEAFIPHLRLLTVPVDKLDPLSKYLTDSQMSYLAKRLMFKVKNVEEIPARLNLNTLPRIRPKAHQEELKKKFKLDLIADDLIKSDWEMMGLEPKRNSTKKMLRLYLVAKQHFVLKGIELLTRANGFPRFKFVSGKSETSAR